MLHYDSESLKAPSQVKCRIPQRLPLRQPPANPTRTSPSRDSQLTRRIQFGIRNKEQNKLDHENSRSIAGCPETTSEISATELNQEMRCWRDNDINQLKENWQKKLNLFEKMKTELNEQQVLGRLCTTPILLDPASDSNAILELYSKMKNTHQKVINVNGANLPMPSPEGLQIMNLTNMSQQQLLRMCEELTKKSKGGRQEIESDVAATVLVNNLSFDINRLTTTPNRLVAACERTLVKRKEMIDWFDSIRTDEKKGISMSTFSKKINEFYTENDLLNSTLQSIKVEFQKELEEIMNCFRKCVNETVNLQHRAAELQAHITELTSQNAQLRKKIQLNEGHQGQFKTMRIRNRIKELEKEVKDEKSKRLLACNKLCRVEGQMKISSERITQLEAALEQARSEAHANQRTVIHLQEANQKLQHNFDRELNKLTESIKENTENVEEIAEAREKLQAENKLLEMRFHELTEQYNESLKKMKGQISAQVAKIADTERKYNNEKEEVLKRDENIKILTTQLFESERKNKEILNRLNGKEAELIQLKDKCDTFQFELQLLKRKLNETEQELDKQESLLQEQNENICKLKKTIEEKVYKETILQNQLYEKDEKIQELLNKQQFLDGNLKESEISAKSYQEQLLEYRNQLVACQTEMQTVKKYLEDMHLGLGDLAKIKDTKKTVEDQLDQLMEKTKVIEDLSQDVYNKENKLKEQETTLMEQRQLLSDKEETIKTLAEKEEKLSKLVALLQDKLERKMVTQLHQKTEEQNAKIKTLTKDVETSKKVVSNLENAMISLKEQLRSLTMKRKIDQEKITLLEQTIAEYEGIEAKCKKSPVLNLEHLIKMLEDELEAPNDMQFEKKINKKIVKKILAQNDIK